MVKIFALKQAENKFYARAGICGKNKDDPGFQRNSYFLMAKTNTNGEYKPIAQSGKVQSPGLTQFSANEMSKQKNWPGES